jgi:hypothetical protein
MLTASLRLSGTRNDGAEVVRSYYLVADFGGQGGGKTSVVPLSLGAPLPDDDRLTVESGSEEAALQAAVEAIQALPGNQGLAAKVVINPE